MNGEASGLVFRVDDLAINLDIEDAAAALDQLSGGAGLFLDCVRQTGGLRGVVSLHAVSDTDLHRSSSCSAAM